MKSTVKRRKKALAEIDGWFSEAKLGLVLVEGDDDWDTLGCYRRVGSVLIKLREVLPHENFAREVKARCGCSKQLCRLLMKLARDWPQVMEALASAAANGRKLRGSDYSVEGALAVAAEWRQELEQVLALGRSRTKSGRSDETETVKRQLESAEAQAARSKARASKEKARRRALEVENARLKSAASLPPIDPKQKVRAGKVLALRDRGCPGERLSAEERLREMAKRHGRSVPQFLKECKRDSSERN